jgi:hypothetical protein
MSTQLAPNEATTAARQRTSNRLRKRSWQGNKKTSPLLGIKFRHIRQSEEYSNRSRGTLGGFLDISEIGADSDSNSRKSMESGVIGEDPCILTRMTKRIGLGIYKQRQDGGLGLEKAGKGEVYDGDDGDERETWYMFYPPPPSPSLLFEQEDWVSTPSSIRSEKNPESAFRFEFFPKHEPDNPTLQTASSKESLYHASIVRSPDDNIAKSSTINNPSIDIDTLVASAEDLADQYRNLLSVASPLSRNQSNASYTPSLKDTTSIPLPLSVIFRLPLALPLPLQIPAPTPTVTAHHLRKVKAQPNLHRLLDPISSIDDNDHTYTFDLDPSEVPSPNEPEWTFLPAPTSGRRNRKHVDPPTPPPSRSTYTANMTHRLQHSSEPKDTRISTECTTPERSTRPPLTRRNAQTVIPIAANRQADDLRRVTVDMSRQRTSFPSVILKRQWEDAFYGHGLGQGMTGMEVVGQAKRYGIVGLEASVMEDEGVAWL